jgi:phosphodiesterase/alkaline phosphatase D-like protein
MIGVCFACFAVLLCASLRLSDSAVSRFPASNPAEEYMLRKALILLSCTAIAFAQSAVQITQGPKVEHADSTTAIIAWSTNVSSGTAVKYGTDPSNLTQTAAMPWGGITHRVTINNLQPNTTYFFQAVSDHAQGSGTDVVSNVAQFQTAGLNASSSAPATTNSQPSQQATPSTASPVQIAAGPIPQRITDTSATIWWESAQPTTVAVKYGTTANALNRTAQDTGQATAQTHQAQLTGLQPGVTYYVALVDSTGNQLSTTEFRTHAANGSAHASEVSDGPIFEFISDHEAVIAWSTAQKTSTVVRYGTDPGNLNLTAQGAWAGGSEAHRVQLTNLHPNTKYWFEIETAQNAGSVSPTRASTSSTTSAPTATSTTPTSHSTVGSSAAASAVTRYPFQTVANASAALRFTPK